MKLKYITNSLFGLLILFSSRLYSQQYYNQTSSYLNANQIWVFPDSITLNARNSSIIYNSSITGIGVEGYTSVAHPNTGELLFYSDGVSVWDKSHELMSNGSGMLGNSSISQQRTTVQGTVIVPFTNDTTRYYIFTLAGGYVDFSSSPIIPPTKLYYSVIDMELNAGMGDVVPGLKNILLDSARLSESMIAVPGDNCDVWLITHLRDSAIFQAFHITDDGVDSIPVLSYTGSEIQGTITTNITGMDIIHEAYSAGLMCISPTRKKLALACTNLAATPALGIATGSTGHTWGTLLCDFNPSSGEVSNSLLIDSVPGFSVAFSPNGNVLYVSGHQYNSIPAQIYQFDLSTNDPTQIVNSKDVIYNGLSFQYPHHLKLYGEKVYLLRPDLNGIDRINNPNLIGTASNYQTLAFSFSNPLSGVTFPTEIVAAKNPDTIFRIMDTLICESLEDGLVLTAQGGMNYEYEWNDGTVDESILIYNGGKYWVRYNNGCSYAVDSFNVLWSSLDPHINVNGFTLGTSRSYTNYQWLLNGSAISGATDSVHIARENGNYQVVVSDDICQDTSEVYEVDNVNIRNPKSENFYIEIYPNPTQGQILIRSQIPIEFEVANIEGKTLDKISGAKQVNEVDLSQYPPGVYLLRLKSELWGYEKTEKVVLY